jgi:hypothetical protein
MKKATEKEGGIIPARLIARDLDLDQKQFIPRSNELQSHDMPQEAKIPYYG